MPGHPASRLSLGNILVQLGQNCEQGTMEIKSVLVDDKVKARSILIEIKVSDYLVLAESLLKSNPFQRKRVRGSKTVYSLLKADILAGCVIPPIVLAYTKANGTIEQDLRNSIENEKEFFSLLDGLQRSYTLLDLKAETIDQVALNKFLNGTIRCEIYSGINRLGILYRMLTLNTGQTAMSLRHQIEIMYLDYLSAPIKGVRLLREVDENRARQLNEYNFKDVIEGFNSYLERSESPLDRGDILDNIASLENLAKENNNHDLFGEYVTAWHSIIRKISGFNLALPIEDDGDDDQDGSETRNRLWATTGTQAFKRPQALSGFGAAIGLLRDSNDATSFRELPIDQIFVGAEPAEFMSALNASIDNINKRAKRIGNAQRLFFRQFFKMLFWRDSGCYLNLSLAQDEAYRSAVKIGI